MMYPRMKLARSLLRPDGLVCISINDIELANLLRIGDEIYGEENLAGVHHLEGSGQAREHGGYARNSALSVRRNMSLFINETRTREPLAPCIPVVHVATHTILMGDSTGLQQF